MLAQHGPLANESVTWNSYRRTELTCSAQNFPIPSRPRCPAPAGSSSDGPTGSSIRASGANKLSHSALRPAATAAIERCPARRAGCAPSGAAQLTVPATAGPVIST